MTSWTDSPCVWRSWHCQLVRLEQATTEVVIDAIALEQSWSTTAVVTTGEPFAIRAARNDVNGRALDVVAAWADDLESVLILGGRHDRRSWMCLSRRHDRVVLVGTVWSVRPPRAREAADQVPAAFGQEHPPPTWGPVPVPHPAAIDRKGER
jgi:hypothetical protein